MLSCLNLLLVLLGLTLVPFSVDSAAVSRQRRWVPISNRDASDLEDDSDSELTRRDVGGEQFPTFPRDDVDQFSEAGSSSSGGIDSGLRGSSGSGQGSSGYQQGSNGYQQGQQLGGEWDRVTPKGEDDLHWLDKAYKFAKGHYDKLSDKVTTYLDEPNVSQGRADQGTQEELPWYKKAYKIAKGHYDKLSDKVTTYLDEPYESQNQGRADQGTQEELPWYKKVYKFGKDKLG